MYTDLHIICFGFQSAAITGRFEDQVPPCVCVLAILHPAAETLRKREKQMSQTSPHTAPNYVGTAGQEAGTKSASLIEFLLQVLFFS